MLPDFASIIGAKLITVAGDTKRGVEWHHKTDAAFHSHAVFRDHAARLTTELAERGIGRGGSLAAGHVGIELLLDGELLDDNHVGGETLYLAALAAVAGELESIELGDRRADTNRPPRQRFKHLIEVLADHGLPRGYKDVDVVTDRVIRVLARRPRLAIPESQRKVLATALEDAKRELAGDVAALTSGLREALLIEE